MSTTRTHVILPTDVLKEIDSLVGKRGRSAFLTEIAEQEVKRRKLLAILRRKGPIWKTENHPELKDGSAAWVSKMRRESDRIRKRT
jgi:metal-responsive CopG/Arc/MetJ family transcriptional regulator